MKNLFILASIVSLAACSGIPPEALGSEPTVQQSDKDRLVAAIESNGCTISPETVGAILAQASVNETQLISLSAELSNEGRLLPDENDNVRLTSPNCI